MTSFLDKITWNSDGLVPAIAQDHESGRILMMAWMNAESLSLTVHPIMLLLLLLLLLLLDKSTSLFPIEDYCRLCAVVQVRYVWCIKQN